MGAGARRSPPPAVRARRGHDVGRAVRRGRDGRARAGRRVARAARGARALAPDRHSAARGAAHVPRARPRSARRPDSASDRRRLAGRAVGARGLRLSRVRVRRVAARRQRRPSVRGARRLDPRALRGDLLRRRRDGRGRAPRDEPGRLPRDPPRAHDAARRSGLSRRVPRARGRRTRGALRDGRPPLRALHLGGRRRVVAARRRVGRPRASRGGDEARAPRHDRGRAAAGRGSRGLA